MKGLCHHRAISQGMGLTLRSRNWKRGVLELNDTGVAFGGQIGPDLAGWDRSPVLRNPYAHGSISLIQVPGVRGWWGDATAVWLVWSEHDHQWPT